MSFHDQAKTHNPLNWLGLDNLATGNCLLKGSVRPQFLSILFMSDDKSKVAQDRKFINVNEDYELRYWTEEFGISAERLKAIVEKIGTSAQGVRDYLKTH